MEKLVTLEIMHEAPIRNTEDQSNQKLEEAVSNYIPPTPPKWGVEGT